MVLLPVSSQNVSLTPSTQTSTSNQYRYTDASSPGTALVHSQSLDPSPAQALVLAVLRPMTTARQVLNTAKQELSYLANFGTHQTRAMVDTLAGHGFQGAPHHSWSWDFHLTMRVIKSCVTIPGNTLSKARAPANLARYLPVPRDVVITEISFSVNKPQLLRCQRESEEWHGPGVDGWSLPIDIGPPLYDLEAEWIDCHLPKTDIAHPEQVHTSTSLIGGIVSTIVNPKGFLTNFLAPTSYQPTSEKVILYLHGGAYSLLSTKTHRAMTCRLARLTGARVFSLEYRLAPEHPFPAAVLDAFAAWLYLTVDHPAIPQTNPPRTLYKPENIIVMGDSAGGGLSCALMSYLKDWIRDEQGLPRYGLPRAAILMSPWVDLTCSHPSWTENAKYDYLPTNNGSIFEPMFEDGTPNPVAGYLWGILPDLERRYWIEPKDFDLEEEHGKEECAAAQVVHPLVSPFYSNLKGMPPMLIQAGECELLRDETVAFAKKLMQAGGHVRHELYSGMPHVFQAFQFTQASRIAFKNIAKFYHNVFGDSHEFVEHDGLIKVTSPDEQVEHNLLSKVMEEEVFSGVTHNHVPEELQRQVEAMLEKIPEEEDMDAEWLNTHPMERLGFW